MRPQGGGLFLMSKVTLHGCRGGLCKVTPVILHGVVSPDSSHPTRGCISRVLSLCESYRATSLCFLLIGRAPVGFHICVPIKTFRQCSLQHSMTFTSNILKMCGELHYQIFFIRKKCSQDLWGLVDGTRDMRGRCTARSGRSARSERSADTSPAPAPVGMKSSMPMIAM